MNALAYLDQTSQFEDNASAETKRAWSLSINDQLNGSVDTGSSSYTINLTPTLGPINRSLLTFLSDGSSISRPSPMTVKTWRSLPTSAGKSFEWEGVVISISGDNFEARLQNIKGAELNSSEYAEFSLNVVPPGDRDLVREGGIFRWVVGLEARSGTRQKYSKVVFRRLPAWTRKSQENATNRLKDIVSEISWAEDESTE